ncbi:MAG: outer membrane protein transport protein [Puniceicoccales bacterium]|jgi:long-chain fatty acid transport protein|nr:outer membrane protein transport protein [Puniceicoccales bacterium]
MQANNNERTRGIFARATRAAFGALTLFAAMCTEAGAQGVIFRGMGAVNESMGGAGIAAPLDSMGAIYTNPAALVDLPSNEVSFGLGGLMPASSVSSSYVGPAAAAYGERYGKTDSKRETYYTPSFSVARHVGKWTFGVSTGAIGGASARYTPSGDGTNPILGTYGKSSKVKVIELMPTAAYKYNDIISVGVTGVVGCFALAVDPMPFDRLPAEPDGPLYHSRTDYTFGGGANAGIFLNLGKYLPGFKTGFVVKSPVVAEPFRFSGASTPDSTGYYRETNFRFALPLVLGWGASYTPHKDWLLALDVRYFDYANTPGFKPANVIDGQGRVAGLGWDSVLSVAVGVQFSVTDDIKLRAGYCWSENPIPGEVQFANVVAPLFIQHVASLGLSYTIAATNTDIVLGYSHAFRNSMDGTAKSGPGASFHVKNTVSAETFFLGLTQRF